MANTSPTYDVIILGAGGAGMMCAIEAGKRGRRVALVDHSKKVGGKILISGGGRCNFTNRTVSQKNYYSDNKHFCKSAFSRFTSQDFINMVERHSIPYHERRWGQLFCDDSAQRIIDMLTKECADAGATFLLNHEILSVVKSEIGFQVVTSQGALTASSVVVATGGLSIPKVGATGIGYKIAEQYGLRVLPRAPALDGFVLSGETGQILDGFAGIALDVRMTCNGISFQENLLFTHLGLSGPVSLQVSLHWHPGDKVFINFVPQMDRAQLLAWFEERKRSKQEIKNLITDFLPKRLAERFTELYLPPGVLLANLPKKDLEHFCEMLQNWAFFPHSTVGYGKAEVTRGGVDTNELSSKTMEARRVPGLYFIGEVVDVTGWLGGYNFQWAWASGWAAGQVV